MALNYFYNKKSRTDGTYRKYLENEIEGMKKSNDNLREKIRAMEAEIAKNEETIKEMSKEYDQLRPSGSIEKVSVSNAHVDGVSKKEESANHQTSKYIAMTVGVLLLIAISAMPAVRFLGILGLVIAPFFFLMKR